MMLNKLKIRSRNHIVEVFFISMGLLCVTELAIAATTSAWSCGAWVTDKNDSCKEVKKCTRTSCATKGKIDKCVTETQTSTATKANCPPLNQKPSAGRFTKDRATPGTMASTPSTTPKRTAPKRTAPTNSNQVLQPRAIVNSPEVPKPTTGRGVKPATNMGATTKQSQKGIPKTKVKITVNQNTTKLPYSRNMPTVKQPALSGVPVVRTNKPKNRNLVAVPIVNRTSGLPPLNNSVNNQNSSQFPSKEPSSGFVPNNIANIPAINTLDSRAIKSEVKTYNSVESKDGANLIVSARWESNSANWLMDKCILKEPHGFKPRHTDVWATSCDLVVTIKNVGDIVVPRAVVNGDSESGNIIESRVQVSYKKIRGNGRVLDAKLKRRLNPIQPGQIVTVVFEKGHFDSFYGLSQLIKIKVNLRNEFVETKKSDNLVNIRISDF